MRSVLRSIAVVQNSLLTVVCTKASHPLEFGDHPLEDVSSRYSNPKLLLSPIQLGPTKGGRSFLRQITSGKYVVKLG